MEAGLQSEEPAVQPSWRITYTVLRLIIFIPIRRLSHLLGVHAIELIFASIFSVDGIDFSV